MLTYIVHHWDQGHMDVQGMFLLHLEFQIVDILGFFVQRQQGESILRKSQMSN